MRIIDEQFRPELEAAGLLSLDDLFSRADLEVVKATLAERQTFRLACPGGAFYIKRYTDPSPESFWGGLFAQHFDSAVQREWAVLRRLYKLGIDAPIPAACLEEREGSRIRRAALITRGLPVTTNLEALAQTALPAARRQRLASRLGRILRTMHDGGVNHRDFYLVHILVGEGDRLYVTDLNRADIRRRVTHRWRVKDIAALLHSAPATVTATDKARFLRAYMGRKGLRGARDIVNAVMRKAARMTAHTRKQVARQQPNFHVVE